MPENERDLFGPHPGERRSDAIRARDRLRGKTAGAAETSLKFCSLLKFQRLVIDFPGHLRSLGENNLLGVERSLEASTDVHSLGVNIARDCRLSSKRERTAGDVPLDRTFYRDVSDAFQVTRHLSIRMDKRMLHLARRLGFNASYAQAVAAKRQDADRDGRNRL